MWPFTRRHTHVTEQKDTQTGPLIFMQFSGRAVWTPRDYASLAREAYVKNAVAYRCVKMLSEAAASVPFLVYEGDKEMEIHPALDLFSRPNPSEGSSAFLERFYSFYTLAGNSYVEAVMLDGKMRELWSLRPDRMRIEVGTRGYPSAFIYKVGQNETRFDVSGTGQMPIMHFRSFHPVDDLYGLSAVEAGAFAIDVHNSAGAFNKALLDNQARPSGALVYSGGKDGRGHLTDEQYGKLKNEMEEQYSGSRNAGRPMLLEGGLDWKEMGTSPRDMEFVEGKREAAREVALSFGVPPMLLGIPGDNTYANYAEANRAFYRQTVIPLVDRACDAFTSFMTPTFGEKFRLWYDLDEVPALAIERDKVWEKVQGADWLSVDEKRDATGYSPYTPPSDSEMSTEPGRVLLIPSTSVPITDMGLTLGGDSSGKTPPIK